MSVLGPASARALRRGVIWLSRGMRAARSRARARNSRVATVATGMFSSDEIVSVVRDFTAERVMHKGLDVATAHGTPVIAPADGTVLFAGMESGYGKVVVLDHGYGLKTRYGHLSEALVKVGDRIRRGDRIASVGNTGRSTGPHLHYEVRVNGIPENPRKFILE